MDASLVYYSRKAWCRVCMASCQASDSQETGFVDEVIDGFLADHKHSKIRRFLAWVERPNWTGA